MKLRPDEISTVLTAELKQYSQELDVESVGTILQVGDGIARIYGLRDVMAGKPSELEAWNGAVHRFGRERGVPTPVHSMVYHLLLPMERRARAAA